MALPTLQDAKDYCRVETDAADGLLASLLARAKASIETWIGYPLIAVPRTWVSYGREYTSADLQLPGPFLATGPAPVFTDVDGTTVEATSYILDGRSGRIRAVHGGYFAAAPYTVVATIGLSAHPDYATRLEAVAGTAILDLVAHYYQNRNPGVSSEMGGGPSLVLDGIPPRIQSDLMLLPGGGLAVA